MDTKKIICLIIISFFLKSCRNFQGEKIEINYQKGYIKVLSDDFVIDKISISNHVDKYYVIGLVNKKRGTNIIYYNKKNVDYKIYIDSLEYYCSQIPKVESPGLDIVIRKKGILDYNNENFTNIEYFSYNQIPCSSSIIDTIEALGPYK